MPTNKSVPFVDFKRQVARLRKEIDQAVGRVLESGRFVLGEEGWSFEVDYARYLGIAHAVGCASGTDAIALSLMALGVGPGDEVITVPNTALPTATAISMTGATPAFVDVEEETLLMDASRLEGAVSSKTRAIVPVHLYGNPVDMDPILDFAHARGLYVVEDACQAHGASYKGKKVGTLGDMGCFSFYPTKNLGAFGDAGMVVTRNDVYDGKLRQLRNYGQSDRYHHECTGINSRMDELQAAILRVKLKILDTWNEQRIQIGSRYDEAFAGLPLKPIRPIPKGEGVCHLYVVRTERREQLRRFLEEKGICTLIHYPIPIHRQNAYAGLNLPQGAFPEAERSASEILSLPGFPELEESEQKQVTQAVAEYFDR